MAATQLVLLPWKGPHPLGQSCCWQIEARRTHDSEPSALFHSEKILKLATSIPRENLVSVGTCFGKFTKTQKFRLHVTALDYLAPYAKVRRA